MVRDHARDRDQQRHRTKSTGQQPAQNPCFTHVSKCLIRQHAKVRILTARNQVVVGREKFVKY